jgi:ubiquinone/menaquinone biosynthesis C-methylase UbiE
MKLSKIITKYFLKNKYKRTTVGTSNESVRISWLEATLNKIPKGSAILDAGAGEQQFKKFCSHLKYVSQDFAQYKPEDLKSGLQMEKWDYGQLDIVSDIANIPVANESFDAIMCTEVFEHIINPTEAVVEFSRILKMGGYLIITAPFCSLTHFAPYHFYSGFNRFFYEAVLENNGFDIIELVPNGNYFEYLAQEVNRLPHMAKKYCQKTINKREIDIIGQLKVLLQNLSNSDSNSSELLCFGYHVLAQKK